MSDKADIRTRDQMNRPRMRGRGDAGAKIPGLGQITWWMVQTKKIERPFGEKKFTEIDK